MSSARYPPGGRPSAASRAPGAAGRPSPFSGRYAGSGWFLEIAEDGALSGLMPASPGQGRESVTGHVSSAGQVHLIVPDYQYFTDDRGRTHRLTLTQSRTARATRDADGDLLVVSADYGAFLAYRVGGVLPPRPHDRAGRR